MTDNEIIKALECCSSDDANCDDCPANKYCTNDDFCLTGAILDLINRQQAEIKELTYKLECLLCHATGSKLSKASYTLETMERAVTDYINDCCYETDAETKSEAIKEFAERLKDYIENIEYSANVRRKTVTVETLLKQVNWILHDIVPTNIDNLVKEMIEEINA